MLIGIKMIGNGGWVGDHVVGSGGLRGYDSRGCFSHGFLKRVLDSLICLSVCELERLWAHNLLELRKSRIDYSI